MALSLLTACAGGLAPKEGSAWGFTAEARSGARYVTQPVDHFGANEATWQQAFFTNSEHWTGTGPVFLYIGGEGPLSSASVVSNFVVDWLPEVHGLLFALEHRYYGCHNASSCPFTPGTTSSPAEQMKYLTTEQALADLASFHDYALSAYGVPNGVPWVAIGGSYPGMLAAFVRATYPERFVASVASSAPVHGVLDFTGFQDAIARGYTMDVEGVHGSPDCSRAIAAGHVEVRELLKSESGRAELARLFPSAVPSARWLESDENQRAFAGCGVASFPAQSNEPACSAAGCGVTQICAIMTANATAGGSSPLARLAALAKAQASSGVDMTGGCEMDWEMPGDLPPAGQNYWGWQCCTEYGFYQTCEEGTACFYAQGLVSFAHAPHQPDDYCASQFGIARADSSARIRARGARYARLVANASRILWVNGDLDPWHAASNLASPGREQPTIWPVKGAHHCAWMSARSGGDQESVADAREKIYAQIRAWISI